MIETITLRDLGVIVEAEIELGEGFTVITGETGAGKTMLLTGIGLLLGARADPSRVRQGSSHAAVEGVLTVHERLTRDKVQQVLDDVGGTWDDDALIIVRTVAAEGRSRAHLGGRSVPTAKLTEIADLLVAVHGQDDQMRLLDSRRQRAALDAFAGEQLRAVMDDYQAVYRELKDAIVERSRLVEESQERAREVLALEDLLEQIERIAPQVGEGVSLRRESVRLSHADTLVGAVSQATALVRGDDDEPGAADRVARAEAALRAVAEHDAQVAGIADRLRENVNLLQDIAVDLASAVSAIEANPQRLAHVEARRAEIAALLRRFGAFVGNPEPDEGEVLDWLPTAQVRRAELAEDPARIERLDALIEGLRETLAGRARDLRAARIMAAQELSARITAELGALAMPKARLEIQVRPRPAGAGLAVTIDGVVCSADRYGVDDVVFEFAGHPDEEARPIGRGVSGGERSRLMLALEVVLVEADPVPTMVFDEVDTGVGGRAAVEVGRRLARLARRCQVLVVTHLPQVAAFADRHLVVSSAGGEVTRSHVVKVEGQARNRELARMLAGLEESQAAAAHAEELLALAEAERASADPPPQGSTGSTRGVAVEDTPQPPRSRTVRPRR
jgi:DNA repair protein RecN (Recombination protein N)